MPVNFQEATAFFSGRTFLSQGVPALSDISFCFVNIVTAITQLNWLFLRNQSTSDPIILSYKQLPVHLFLMAVKLCFCWIPRT